MLRCSKKCKKYSDTKDPMKSSICSICSRSVCEEEGGGGAGGGGDEEAKGGPAPGQSEGRPPAPEGPHPGLGGRG